MSLQPVTVTPDGKIPKPLVVQLQDARGNPSSEANIKIILGTDEAIKVQAQTAWSLAMSF